MSVNIASACKEVQDFQFKILSKHQIREKLSIPVSCSLVVADGKRGLVYIGHQKVISVIKLNNEGNIEWRNDLNLLNNVTRLSLNCDSSLLAVTFLGPSVLIYSAASISKNVLDLLHEIRLSSSSGEINVCDLRWNPAIPGMLCTVTSDHTIGSFQVSNDKKSGFVITGSGRIEGVDALCAAWSPKGKQIVVGCQNGNIIQLKPELKPARVITGPNPNMGRVIAILWISNFQFCAAYQEINEKRVCVLIVDAPKGETIAKFTNFEDITYGVSTNQYYFDYIPEWGVIIAASSSSSEVAVLGTGDNGISWEQWQLVDNGRAELPLVRTEESFPVGLTIDRSSTTPLALNPENILPNPVPVLHILATSGQLCSFHIVNFKENSPAICVPPSEIVIAPLAPVTLPAPRPSLGSSEISFNLMPGVTSTPRAKMESPKEKPKNIPTNFFTDNSKPPDFAPKFGPEKTQAPVNLPPVNLPPVNLLPVNLPNLPVNLPIVNMPPAPLAKLETKVNTFVQQPEPKIVPPVELKIPKPQIENIPKQTKPEVKLQKEMPVKETIPEKSNIDDGLCLRAYREEQVNFEKELKTKLEPLTWEVGTKAEKEQLVEKTMLIDEFLRDLQETTSSLASDIAFLRGFLIQSFAWLEETNSKNSENVKLSTRNRRDNSKLAELQKLYYYTQSQLVQASKVLDLQWSEQQSREQKKMKIPSMECIYQSLMRHGQILAKERSNIEGLIRKWKTISRGNSVSDLNRSISNLQISMNSHFGNDSAIDLRCKAIANMNQNFSREKQMKLRDFLSESVPRIIKPAKPTLIQDRLESTLSSLASMSPTKVTKPKAEQKLTPSQKKVQSPLASLNNIVSKIGMPGEKLEFDTNSQKIAVSPVSALPAKTGLNVPALTQKPKQINISFGQNAQTSQNLVKPFPKVEAISFGQKSEEKSLKDGKSRNEKGFLGKSSEEMGTNSGINFSGNNAGSLPIIQSTFSLQSSVPVSVSTAAQAFSFASKPATSVPFSFASKPEEKSNLESVPFSFASKPEEKSNLDLGGLNLSQSGLTITPISETKTVNQPTPAMSSINFGKAAAPSIFGNSGTTFGNSGATFGTTGPNFGSTGANFGTTGANFGTTGASTFGSPTGSTFGTSGTTFGIPTTSTFGTSAPSAPVTSTATFGTPNAFGTATSGANTFAASGTNAFGTPTSTFGTPTSTFGTSSGNAFGTATSGATFATSGANTFGSPTGTTFGTSGANAFGTNTFASGSPFGKGSIFGGNSAAPSAPPSAPPGAPPSVLPSAQPSMLPGAQSSMLPSAQPSMLASAQPSMLPSAQPSMLPSAQPSVLHSLLPSSQPSVLPNAQPSAIPSALPSVLSTAPITVSSTSSLSTPPVASSTLLSSVSTNSTPVISSISSNGSTPSSANSSSVPSSVTSSVIVSKPVSMTSPILASSLASPSSPSSVPISTPPPSYASPSVSVASSTNSNLDMLSLSLGTSKPSISFQTPTSSTSSIFSTPSFGAASSAAATLNFGSASSISSSNMIAPAFGKEQTASPGSIFGGTTAAAGNVFGKSPSTPNANPFGGNTIAQSPTSGSVFGNAGNSTGNSIFGGGATTGTGFGMKATPTSTGSVFGMSSPQSSVFGGAGGADTSLFGGVAAKPQETNFSMFGGSSAAGGGSSMFGQAPAFGTKPAFGATPDFGQAKSVFGSGFGASPSFGSNPASTGFGSPPMMGGSPPALGGNSMQKVFGGAGGSNTFESLANQSGGLSFSSLAQSSPEQQQQQKPPEFAVKSSFSSWR